MVHIEKNIVYFDNRYVNITGDTMTGALVITPTADTTSILQVNQADTTVVLNVDTTNARVGIGTATPLVTLDIPSAAGNVVHCGYTMGVGPVYPPEAEGRYVSSGATAGLQFLDRAETTWQTAAGKLWTWYSTGNVMALFSGGNLWRVSSVGNFIIGTSTPTSARFEVEGRADEIQTIIKAHSSQSANILEIQDSSANVLSGAGSAGRLFSDLNTDASNLFMITGGNTTTSGTGNIAIGSLAGQDLTSGSSNFLVGTNAGREITEGSSNVGIGGSSLRNLTTGDNNFAFGGSSLREITTTGNNVVIGNSAFNAGTTVENSVAIGTQAGQKITGGGNVFIGRSVASFGHASVQTAERNVAIGLSAFTVIETGANNNVAIGYSAGIAVTTGANNLLIGQQVGLALTTGSRNVFLGGLAGGRQTTNSDLLIIDNQLRADVATELTNSILYGVMAAAPANQTLRINAMTTIAGEVEAGGATTKVKITSIGGVAVKLTNTTGANTVAGQTVKADPATNDAVILTAADDNECIGVFLDSGVADDAEAWVVVSGIADVAMEDNTAATRGNWVETSDAEAGYANAESASPIAAPQHFNEIGHCIESVAAGGGGTHILARCVLHFN